MNEKNVMAALKYLRIAKYCFVLVWLVIFGMILVQYEDIPKLVLRSLFWCGMGFLCLRRLKHMRNQILDAAV